MPARRALDTSQSVQAHQQDTSGTALIIYHCVAVQVHSKTQQQCLCPCVVPGRSHHPDQGYGAYSNYTKLRVCVKVTTQPWLQNCNLLIYFYPATGEVLQYLHHRARLSVGGWLSQAPPSPPPTHGCLPSILCLLTALDMPSREAHTSGER